MKGSKPLTADGHCLGGPPKPELSSRGQAPFRTGFPYEVSVLGTHLYQCTSWYCCERLRLALVKLF